MNASFVALLLSVSGSVGATPVETSLLRQLTGSAGITAPSIEAANRKGSHRVGGSGRSGKGGRYVGGRR
jgi:hypothetical protein